MKTNIYLRKLELSPEKKDTIIKKVDKLSKFFDEDVASDIVISSQRDKIIVEATIRTPDMIYRAEERNEDVYNATDEIVESISRQIRKNKTRLAKRLRQGINKDFVFADEPAEDESEIKIVKTKTHHVKPMSAEEAVLQMNLLNHSFFVFRNAQTNTTDIVYRRKDGNYGLIETD